MAKLSSDDIIAVGIIEGLGVLGLASNGLAMLILIKGGKISHSFQQLCFSNCTANFICLALFVFYCAPVIILQSNFSHTSPIAKLISGFMVAIWDVSVYSHLMSSINRLIVISWPIESRKILNQRNTKVLIGIAWFLGFLHFIPYFRVEKCYVVFYASKYIWEFSPNYCGFVLGKVLDFGTGVSVFILIIIFDLYTVLRIRTVMIYSHPVPLQGLEKKRQCSSYYCINDLGVIILVSFLMAAIWIIGQMVSELMRHDMR